MVFAGLVHTSVPERTSRASLAQQAEMVVFQTHLGELAAGAQLVWSLERMERFAGLGAVPVD